MSKVFGDQDIKNGKGILNDDILTPTQKVTAFEYESRLICNFRKWDSNLIYDSMEFKGALKKNEQVKSCGKSFNFSCAD